MGGCGDFHIAQRSAEQKDDHRAPEKQAQCFTNAAMNSQIARSFPNAVSATLHL
jgi:hypothetical protein